MIYGIARHLQANMEHSQDVLNKTFYWKAMKISDFRVFSQGRFIKND